MTDFNVDDDLVRRLAALLEETGLTEIEYSSGDERIRVSRAAGGMVAAPVAAAPTGMPTPETSSDAHPGAVTAPMVGTVYLAPEPGSDPFVRIGDSVVEGQTLLLIEAMKTYNPVRAPRAGKVVRILVADAQPVEYGGELMIIE